MSKYLWVALMVLLVAFVCLGIARVIHTPDCEAIGYDRAVIMATGVFCERTERIKLVDFEGMAQ